MPLILLCSRMITVIISITVVMSRYCWGFDVTVNVFIAVFITCLYISGSFQYCHAQSCLDFAQFINMIFQKNVSSCLPQDKKNHGSYSFLHLLHMFYYTHSIIQFKRVFPPKVTTSLIWKLWENGWQPSSGFFLKFIFKLK